MHSKLGTYIAFILLSSLGFISTDIYITSLPLISEKLNTSNIDIQRTISFYFIGLGISQLIYGLLSNKYQIKQLIHIGMFIYTISCIFCFYSTTENMLLLARCIQAFGAASGLVFGREIICSLYPPKEALKVLTITYSFVGMSPIIFPFIGSLLTQYFSWNSNFVFLFNLGLIAWISIIVSIFSKFNQDGSIEGKIKKNHCVNKRLFLVSILIVCFADGTYFSYLIKSPYIFESFKYTQIGIGLLFLPTALSYFLGNWICKYYSNKFSINYLLLIGGNIFFTSLIVLFALLKIFNINHPYAYILSISILTFANGFLIPCGTFCSVNTFIVGKGMASGILGISQFLWIGILTEISNYVSINLISLYLLILGMIVLIATLIVKNLEESSNFKQAAFE